MRLLACPELRCPCASRLRFYMVVCTGPKSLHSMTNLVYSSMCFPGVESGFYRFVVSTKFSLFTLDS